MEYKGPSQNWNTNFTEIFGILLRFNKAHMKHWEVSWIILKNMVRRKWTSQDTSFKAFLKNPFWRINSACGQITKLLLPFHKIQHLLRTTSILLARTVIKPFCCLVCVVCCFSASIRNLQFWISTAPFWSCFSASLISRSFSDVCWFSSFPYLNTVLLAISFTTSTSLWYLRFLASTTFL